MIRCLTFLVIYQKFDTSTIFCLFEWANYQICTVQWMWVCVWLTSQLWSNAHAQRIHFRKHKVTIKNSSKIPEWIAHHERLAEFHWMRSFFRFDLQMNQQCKVCGEPAAGFHFGAFTCEGCKVSSYRSAPHYYSFYSNRVVVFMCCAND